MLKLVTDDNAADAAPGQAADTRLTHEEIVHLLDAIRPEMNGPKWFGLSSAVAKLEAVEEALRPLPATPPADGLAYCTDSEFRRWCDDLHHDIRMQQIASMPMAALADGGDAFDPI